MMNYMKARICQLIRKNDGMEMLQVLLIAGLVLVIIVAVFYPQVEDFFESMMDTITDWFADTGSKPFDRTE